MSTTYVLTDVAEEHYYTDSGWFAVIRPNAPIPENVMRFVHRHFADVVRDTLLTVDIHLRVRKVEE